eukprot:gene7917-9743_t
MDLSSNNYIDLACSDEKMWKVNRSLVSKSFSKINIRNIVNEIIENESLNLVNILSEKSSHGEPICPKSFCQKYTLNIILKYILSQGVSYSNESDNSELLKKLHTFFEEYGVASRPDDFIDILIPFSNIYRKYLKSPIMNQIVDLLRAYYDSHKLNLNPEKPKDLFDSLILESERNETITKEQVLMIIVDLIAGGTDTAFGNMQFFFLYMANYPEIQEKAYSSLVNEFGKGHRVKLSDKKVPYVLALEKELLRIKPPGPLSIPRCASNDITIEEENLFIPKGTMMIQNLFSALHCYDYWDQPFEFIPERFLKSEENVAFIPFSVGPRNCVGSSLALDELYIGISNILMNFEISTVDGKQIDDTEGKGKKYVRFWLGDRYSLVVNDPHLIKTIWSKSFHNFVNRPHIPSFKIISLNYKNLVVADEEICKTNKSLVASAFSKINLKHKANEIIENESLNLVNVLYEKTIHGEPICPKTYCKNYTLNIILKYVLSQEISYTEESKEYKSLIYGLDTLYSEDGSGSRFDILNVFYERHKLNINPECPKDLFDSLILESEKQEKISKEQVLLILVDLIAGGSDTPNGTIQFFFLYMPNYPDIQKKAYCSLVKEYGKENRVFLSDKKVPFILALIKEVLRFQPVGPLSIPRSASNDITIEEENLFIPKGV